MKNQGDMMKPDQLPKYRIGKGWLNNSSYKRDVGVDHKLPRNICQQSHYYKSQSNLMLIN